LLCYHDVIFELDRKNVVDDVYISKIDCFEYGLYYMIVKDYLKVTSHNDYEVVFNRHHVCDKSQRL